MNKLCFLFIMSVVPLGVFAQDLEILRTSHSSLMAEIDLTAGQIRLLESGASNQDLIHNLGLTIKNGELLLSYTLSDFSDNGRYYEVVPEFILNGEKVHILAHEELRGDWGIKINPGNRQMLWINLLDRYINLEGNLEVNLKANLYGEQILPYDCSKGMPSFSLKKKRPYILGAGLGLVSLGAGQLFKQKSEDIYENSYLQSKTQREAAPFYEDANGKHHTYLILTYAGSAILLTDAVLFIIRQARFKKELKLYNRWCQNATVSFVPAVQLSSPISPQGMTGVNIRFSF